MPGQLIVKTVPSAPGIMSAHLWELSATLGAKKVSPVKLVSGTSGTIHASRNTLYKVDFASDKDIVALAKIYQTESWVSTAEPNYYVYATEDVPAITYNQAQSYITATPLKYLDSLPTTKEIIVAVIDSGVDYLHPDLKDQMVLNTDDVINGIDDDHNGYIDDYWGYNFAGFSKGNESSDSMDVYGHGTHIAGIIAASPATTSGVRGVNPDAKILNVRFLDYRGRGTQLDATQAIRYAIKRGARVLNCSWGYTKRNTFLSDAIREAKQQGAMIIASAGNLNTSVTEYPAGFDDVLSIGCVNLDHSRTGFSNWGRQLDFMAYGRQLFNAAPGGMYTLKSGTSQSAAVFSGIVSKILSYRPTLSSDDLYATLIRSSDDLGATGKDELMGYGVINPHKLLEEYNISYTVDSRDVVVEELTEEKDNGDAKEIMTTQQAKEVAAPFTLSKVLNFPNPVPNGGTKFGFEVSQSAVVVIKIYNAHGTLIRQRQENVASGYQTIFWDGLDASGGTVQNGTYFYLITADAQGQSRYAKGKLSVFH